MRRPKFLLAVGLFTTAFGIAAITEEVHGCLMCPLDGFFWYWGTTSERVFGFLVHIRWRIIAAGLLITGLAVTWLKLGNHPILGRKLTIRLPRMNDWRKRRMWAHAAVYALILLHITLAVLGLTELKSLCPRSLGELAMNGQLGTAAVFWAAILVLVLVWGRGLCGWLCVFAPIQEQSVNLLKAMGFNPQRKAFRSTPIIWIMTTMVWSAIAFYLVKNRSNLTFDVHQGQAVASYWVFVVGALTTMPLAMFATHHLGPRWFCKYLCPIGGLQSLYSSLSLGKILIEKSKCTDCGACTRNCQMGVNIERHISAGSPAIADMNCIFCGDCVDKCPTDALRFGMVLPGLSRRPAEERPAPARAA